MLQPVTEDCPYNHEAGADQRESYPVFHHILKLPSMVNSFLGHLHKAPRFLHLEQIGPLHGPMSAAYFVIGEGCLLNTRPAHPAPRALPCAFETILEGRSPGSLY
jgi:hypothetical protein